ncbi:hemerythrin domain-containing protein [Streptomyces sp. NPDC005731]|uniref:hemerythrin domain-containing protein n=1 Tax=Streptomyces sp. NPDC005731 TaxID=3157056 RepID=UPI0033CB1416
MKSAVSERMADVRDMYMAHTMMRREFRLLPQLVRDVTSGDVRRAKVVGAHAELMCLVLHLHHEGEDVVLWPLLLERGGREALSIVPTMEEQHHAIERAHAEVTSLLSGWRATAQGGDRLADALEGLLTVLLEHMALEEKEILPLAAQHVTAAEWEQLGQHGMAKSPKKTLPLAFGMVMYEGDPEVVKAVLAHAPLPARLLMPIIGPRLYASHAKRVHGTSNPPRVGAN